MPAYITTSSEATENIYLLRALEEAIRFFEKSQNGLLSTVHELFLPALNKNSFRIHMNTVLDERMDQLGVVHLYSFELTNVKGGHYWLLTVRRRK